MKNNMPSFLGFGLGLRSEYYEEILNTNPPVDWFEITTENYLAPGGSPLYYLDQIVERYPVVMHGVALSIGSTDPIDYEYLKQVKLLAKRVKSKWISDHLCWNGIHGINTHDLLPMPYTEEAVKHIANRISMVQDYFGQQILIENVSSYLTYTNSTMSEWEFLNAVAEASDCFILLDVNNIYVSGFNHKFDPITYLRGIPVHRVQQIHLAGHNNHGSHILDTHDAPVIQEVWDLYKQTLNLTGQISTMIERDDNMPPLSELIDELNQVRQIANG